MDKKQDKLQIQFPSLGWEQFLTSKKEMLDSFDRAKEKTKSHKVEVYHGKVAEAEFRKWLSSFLPKKYGVTSGYIISPGLKSSDMTPHFDVIIYDQIESPILWIEDSPDTSNQGRSLAIPAEYVHCILEVKSSFTSSTVKDAINHLSDLLPLMSGIDEPQDKYKLHFPINFCCGLIFFNLQKDHQYSEAALKKVLTGIKLRGFFGGVILRGEGHTKNLTGKIRFLSSETPITTDIARGENSLLKTGTSNSVQLSNSLYLTSMIMWLEHNFSQFGFDIIAIMQGAYDIGKISSFYGMGASEWEDKW